MFIATRLSLFLGPLGIHIQQLWAYILSSIQLCVHILYIRFFNCRQMVDRQTNVHIKVSNPMPQFHSSLPFLLIYNSSLRETNLALTFHHPFTFWFILSIAPIRFRIANSNPCKKFIIYTTVLCTVPFVFSLTISYQNTFSKVAQVRSFFFFTGFQPFT